MKFEDFKVGGKYVFEGSIYYDYFVVKAIENRTILGITFKAISINSKEDYTHQYNGRDTNFSNEHTLSLITPITAWKVTSDIKEWLVS